MIARLRERFVFRHAIRRDPGEYLDEHKQNVYPCLVIRTFGDGETERFFAAGSSRRIPTEIRRRAAMRLIQLNAATRVEDLRQPPSNRLELLRGDRAGQWSVRINDQWRVCFRFENGDAFDVEIVDYH
jgi:proteic killer suppression protein